MTVFPGSFLGTNNINKKQDQWNDEMDSTTAW
jgi:hypothetical protein